MPAQYGFIEIPDDVLYFPVSTHLLINLNILSTFLEFLTTVLNNFNKPREFPRSHFRTYHFICKARAVQDAWNEYGRNCYVLLSHIILTSLSIRLFKCTLQVYLPAFHSKYIHPTFSYWKSNSIFNEIQG